MSAGNSAPPNTPSLEAGHHSVSAKKRLPLGCLQKGKPTLWTSGSSAYSSPETLRQWKKPRTQEEQWCVQWGNGTQPPVIAPTLNTGGKDGNVTKRSLQCALLRRAVSSLRWCMPGYIVSYIVGPTQIQAKIKL